MQKSTTLIPLILSLSLLSAPAEAARKKKNPTLQKLSGTVEKCHDGDTCRILVDGKTMKVRFSGVDTPEISQKHGKEAKAYTEGKIKNRKVDLECEGTSWDRRTCTVFLEGVNINRDLVVQGWAYDSAKYSKGLYAQDMAAAKARRLGIWKDKELISPYCYRHKTSKHCRVSQSYMP